MTGASAAARTFDFHIHTKASDGFASAAEILRLAAEQGLEGISITDHDTLDAYREISGAPSHEAPGAAKPWVLAGVEVSTRLGDEEAHVLGYFPDGISSAAEAFIEGILAARKERISNGIVRLRERGIEITWDECARLASGRVVNRSHLAQILAQKRYVGRSHRAYHDLLGPRMVPLPEITAPEAIREIRRLGGLSVWAHPAAQTVSEHLRFFLDAKLDGVEVFIPRRSPRERRELAGCVRKEGLLVTGGSDWHGKPSGPPFGRFQVGDRDISELLARLGR